MSMPASPDEMMAETIKLRQALRFEEAAANYADDALLVIQPGAVVRGRDAVRSGFLAMSQAFPTFEITSRKVFVNGDLALHHSNWTASGRGADGEIATFSGRTADVLVRQMDGQWLVIIDNPWGTAILDE
jgi:ketosteroid isomerase-like protein